MKEEEEDVYMEGVFGVEEGWKHSRMRGCATTSWRKPWISRPGDEGGRVSKALVTSVVSWLRISAACCCRRSGGKEGFWRIKGW